MFILGYNINAGPNPSIVADVGPASAPNRGLFCYGQMIPSGSLQLASQTRMDSSTLKAVYRLYLYEGIIAGAGVEAPIETQRQLFFCLDGPLYVPVAVVPLLPLVWPHDALRQADDALRFCFAEDGVWQLSLSLRDELEWAILSTLSKHTGTHLRVAADHLSVGFQVIVEPGAHFAIEVIAQPFVQTDHGIATQTSLARL